METIILTKNKAHVFIKTVHRGDIIQSGKDVRIEIYKISGTPGAVIETLILASASMDESVTQPGAYLYPYTFAIEGNYKARFFVNGELYPEDDDVIKVTRTDVDEVFTPPIGIYVDFGTIQSFEQGALVSLDIHIYIEEGGDLTDTDELPLVIVRDINTITKKTGIATRLGLGHYKFDYRLENSALVGTWSYEWIFTINSQVIVAALRTQAFNVTVKSIIACGETRSGYAFDNPDLGANNGWGAILTPDELRYIYMMGNDLVAPNFSTMTDSELKYHIDNAIAVVERDLNVTLMKRIYKYREKWGRERTDLNGLEPGIDFEYEDPYDFNAKSYREYIFILLRRRPVLSVEKCIFRDITGGEILDLAERGWIKPNYDRGTLQFFPEAGSLASLPLTFGVSYDYFNTIAARGDYPDAYFIDYTAGFESVRHLRKAWPELFDVIGKLAAIPIMNIFGDGRSPGLASASISLSGISESYATTQSASIDYFDVVELRNKNTKEILKICIGKLFNIRKEKKINIDDYEVLSVNPENINDIQWKQLKAVIQHHVPNKKCYKIFFDNGINIGITEDHSLFEIVDNKLYKKRGSEFKEKDNLAVIVNNKIVSGQVLFVEEYVPKANYMYDLSIEDFENFIVNSYCISHNTNALYGARILAYIREIKDFYKRNQHKFSGLRIGCL